jgi:hypothetical protein
VSEEDDAYMAYVRDRVIVLKNEAFRDDDAWVVLYGEAFGKMEAVARGVRRWDAKHLGHLEPFSEVEVMIAKGAAFDKVAVAKLRQPWRQLRSHLAGLTVAGAFFSCVETLTRPGMADPDVFRLLQSFSETLSGRSLDFSPERGRLLFASAGLKLLDTLGYAPPEPVSGSPAGQDVARIFRFLRERPFADVLCLTLPIGLLRAVGDCAEAAFEQTPLSRVPHGPETILRTLAWTMPV